MENKNEDDLVHKYNQGLCTPEEEKIVESWFLEWKEQGKSPSPDELDEISKRVFASLPGPDEPSVRSSNWPLRVISIAAILAVAIFGFWWFYIPRQAEERAASSSALVNDIKPGGNKATLTLANGKTIALSDVKTGVIVGIDKLMYNDNSLVIQSESEGSGSLGTRDDNSDQSSGALTISTPRGGTYQITLPDGSKVWLNAASTLTYQAVSRERGAVRKARLSGEAYFEVAPDKAHPFIVESGKQTVEVLGTHFNISSYADENTVKTTLLEGSVKVASGRNNLTLKPNQQSVNAGNVLLVKNVDPGMVIAWKSGEFAFSNEPLQSIMNQISRWYDVDVFFNKPATAQLMVNGSISKFENLSEILKMLEITGGIHFKIKERRIVVLD